MASMRDIKRRKGSIKSTKQITKAMKLVSTAKLQKAKAASEKTKPFFQTSIETIEAIIGKTGAIQSSFISGNKCTNQLFIAVSSNRGLAGGYNQNILKGVIQEVKDVQNAKIISIGRKGRDLLRRRGYEIIASYDDHIEEPKYKEARDIMTDVMRMYRLGEVGEVYVTYTKFYSTIRQEAQTIQLLPLKLPAQDITHTKEALMNFEPDADSLLEIVILQYLKGVLYGTMIEASASEHAARMTAMDAATNNAEEMIDKLTLIYNRARQASITQEISEIVGGAEALN